MKKLALLAILIIAMTGCAGMEHQEEFTEFAVETLALGIGYELRDSFEWTPAVQQYYDHIMAGTITLNGAQLAEAYLKKVTHPMIANRLVRLAGMAGFDLDVGGHVVGVQDVNIKYLQVAAQGFKMGLELE